MPIQNQVVSDLDKNVTIKDSENVINTNIENKKTELKDKKDELLYSASFNLPDAIIATSYLNIFNDVLENLNAENYNDAEKNIQDRVEQELLNINGTPEEIRNKAFAILEDTIPYYQYNMDVDFNTSPFKEAFLKAINNTLDKTINQSSSNCDITELTLNFEAELTLSFGEAVLSLETQDTQTQSTSALSRATNSSFLDLLNSPPEIIEYPATKDGYEFKLIDYTIERTTSSGKSYTINKKNEGMYGAILEIKTPDNEVKQIKIKTNTIAKDRLIELVNVIMNLPKENIQDLANEGCTLSLVKNAGAYRNASYNAGTAVGGTCNFETNTISISCNDFIGAIQPAVLVHELGHAVDHIPNGAKYLSSLQCSSYKTIKDMFYELQDSTKYDNYYAFKSYTEFFAEYYTYKSLGYTANQGEDIFEKRKYEEIIKIMDEIIENTRNLDSDERAQSTEKENKDPVKDSDKENYSGNTTTGSSNSNSNGEISSPIVINPPNSPSGSNPFEDSKDDSLNDINNDNSNIGKPNINNNENISNTENSSDETTLPGNNNDSKPTPGDEITTNIETGINVNDIINPSRPSMPGDSNGIIITDNTTKEEVINSLIDKTIDYYTEKAIKEAQEMYGEDANIKVDVECSINEDGEIIVKIKTTILDDNNSSNNSSTNNNGSSTESGDSLNNNGGNSGNTENGENSQPGYYPGVGINIGDYINPNTGTVNTDDLIADWEANGGEVHDFEGKDAQDVWDDFINATNNGDTDDFWNSVGNNNSNSNNTQNSSGNEYSGGFYGGYGSHFGGTEFGSAGPNISPSNILGFEDDNKKSEDKLQFFKDATSGDLAQ